MHQNTEEVLFNGTRLQCREFASTMDREGYVSVRVDRITTSPIADDWQVIATVMWAPSPEEIEAAIKPLRERQQQRPRYSDSPTVMSRPKSTTGQTASEQPRVSQREENVVRIPKGWRP